MEDNPKEVSKIEREMKRLVAKMEAESTALNKILRILGPLNEDEASIVQKDLDKNESKNNPNK
jgi:hypothetical protein